MQRVVPGLDVLLESPALIGNRRWALLANQAAVTLDLVPARTALQAVSEGPLMVLFAPEHGLEGTAQDMESVTDTRDPLTGVTVRSLYGSTAATLEPTQRDLDAVEVVVADLPDIGTRYYTFAATLDAMMAGCERHSKHLIVLDRPNPLTGVAREGGLVQPGFESFVSRVPTPVRHGLTLGELALLLGAQRYPKLEVTVIPCQQWRRSMWWEETGLTWVPPSPNMPSPETALLYPGICLVEATNLSEGRGTTRPFHLVGAPWIDAGVLTERLVALDIPGLALRRSVFRPMFGKYAGLECRGVELFVTGRDELEPLAMGLRILKVIADLYPQDFDWRRDSYEFVSQTPAIDLLTGSAEARRRLEKGESLHPLLATWQRELEAFEQRLEGVLLYY